MSVTAWYSTGIRAVTGIGLLGVATGCASVAPRGSSVDAGAAVPPPAPVGAERPAPPPSTTDGPLALSIEDAVVAALANNHDLAIRQLEPAIAGAFAEIERAEFDAELFARLVLSEEVASETDRATGDLFSVEGEDSETEIGLRKELASGTSLSASLEHERSASDRTPELQTARLGFRVTQALLGGRRIARNLAAVRQAELSATISRHELRAFTEEVLARTEVAYWSFVLARDEISIFENSLEVARRQRDDIEQRIEVGDLPENEAAASRAEVARREQALIDARSLMEATRLRLLRLVSSEPNPYAQVLRATSSPRLEPQAVTNVAQRAELALLSRPELGEARLRAARGRLETIITRDGILPRLDFFVDLGRTGFADSFSESFERLADSETYDLAAGLEFRHLLGNRAAEAQDLSARTSLEQAERAIRNLEQSIRLEVRLAANEVERSRQQIAATAATRALQEDTLRAEQERMDVGVGTALLVAQAQRDLLESRIAEIEAIIAYRITLVRLYQAEGSLLDRRGIAVN